MASFSTTHPFAYHTFPLTAARSLWSSGTLLGKADLGGAVQARRTSAGTDHRLGFSHFVHLYLPRRGASPASLPILGAQLQPALEPACPHALLVVPTAGLADADCSLCNWNIAVSRPGVPGVAHGGNWTRGTNPDRIAEVWRAFRATSPDPVMARGFWGDPEVPILAGDQIAGNLRLLSRAPQKTPELLLRSPPMCSPARRSSPSHAPISDRYKVSAAPGRRHTLPRRAPRIRPRRRPARTAAAWPSTLSSQAKATAQTSTSTPSAAAPNSPAHRVALSAQT